MMFRKVTIFIFIVYIYDIKGQGITLTPQSPATVRQGQSLELTCQSGQTSGTYQFFYVNSEGNRIIYATGGGPFSPKPCLNNTNVVSIECDFGTPWKFKLTLLIPVHNQVVYCQRSGGGLDIKNSSTTIFVQVPVTSVTLSPSSSVEVIEGAPFTFSCESKAARPAANITWYRDGVVVSGGSSSSSMNNLLYDVTSNLTSSFQRTDHGKRIYCTAVNINGDTPIQSAQPQLNVLYAPPAAPQLTADGSTSVDEGQSIILRCTLSTLGNPPITWNWVCGDDSLTTGVTTGTQSVLTLTTDRKYNQRTCQCRATSPRPSLSYNRTSGTRTITVYYVPPAAPQLTAAGNTSVDEGQSITLRCNLSTLGNPNITWSWVCGDDTLTTGVTNTGTQSVLTLTTYRKYNQRTCQCRATTPKPSLSYNRTSGTQTITVYYAPTAAPQLTADGSTSVDEGQSIALRCNLSTLGNPPITWTWVCGGETLTTGVTNTGTQSVLTLTTDKTYNQRTCQCRAKSPKASLSYNRTSETQTITVYYNNAITSNVNKEYVTNEHGQLQIKCDVEGNPLSNITWFFVPNNTVVKRDSNVGSSSLTISSANCLDHGNYTVTAENGKGPADMRTTQVVVRCKPRLFNNESQTPDKLGIGNNESLKIHVRMVLYPPATLTQWRFMKDNDNESKIIENTGDYSITNTKDENKQNITLNKTRVNTEDFGEYTILVQNDVGTFTRIYHVDAARPPLIPTDLTLACDTLPIKLSWISNFNGGDSQTFTISYSTVGDLSTSFKDVENVSDNGYGKLHSYNPSIPVDQLRGTVWFTVTAFNKFGESTSDTVDCFVKVPDKNTSSVAAIAAGAAAGGIGLAVVMIGVVIFVRRNSKHGKQTGKSQRFRNSGGENEDADDDGLKENALYVSADIANDEKPGPSGMAVYAEVKKKSPGLSDNNANVYAEVKKTGPKVGDDKATNGAAKPKKGLFKKEEKPKQKKGKKQKPKQDVPDVYENSEDIAMKQRADDVYSNTGENRPPKPEQRGYKNQDGLLYVEVQFDAKKDNGKSVIHGEEEKTDYATVEFPFPPSSQKAAEGEKKEK